MTAIEVHYHYVPRQLIEEPNPGVRRDTLEYLKAKVGGDKFMLGTDYPYTLGDWLAVEKIHALKCSVAEKDAIGRQC